MSAPIKPGDVVLVQCSDGEWRRAFCKEGSGLDGHLVWVFRDGLLLEVSQSRSLQLVVIDPDDRRDRLGHRWVRVASDEWNDNPTPWRRRGSSARIWDHVNAVEVLSRGVQPATPT